MQKTVDDIECGVSVFYPGKRHFGCTGVAGVITDPIGWENSIFRMLNLIAKQKKKEYYEY